MHLRALLLLPLLAACLGTPPDSSGETAGAPLACGAALSCEADDVCVAERYEPACDARADTGAACPDGTTATLCGGDGHPCCCAPAPEETYTCQGAAACGDTPSCACVTCPGDKACTERASETGREFVCEELAKP
jgi:hypothetical protein